MPITQPDGYLALPAAGTGSPVLVLHAWWGLTEPIHAVCQQLADLGYLAFAPDLYHGARADTIPGAEALSSALDPSQARAEVARAVAFLSARSGQPQGGLAVIGFSLGAYFALELSNADPERIRSVVVFYGTGHLDFKRARAAYLGHFASDDPYEPPDNVAELEAALRQAGRPVEFHHYPGTGHWFFEPDRPQAYDPEAASLAWRRTVAFLRQPAREAQRSS